MKVARGHVVALILSELRGLQSLPCSSMPRAALRTLCEALSMHPRPNRSRPGREHQRQRRTLAAASRARPASASAPGAAGRVLEAMGGWRRRSGDQIALDLGYESAAPSAPMFRRAAGAPPSQFRPATRS